MPSIGSYGPHISDNRVSDFQTWDGSDGFVGFPVIHARREIILQRPHPCRVIHGFSRDPISSGICIIDPCKIA